MTGLPRLFVVYDSGSASLTEIMHSLSDVAELTFVVADPVSEYVAPLLPMIADVATVVTTKAVLADETPRPDGVVTFSERMVGDACAIAGRFGLPGPGPASLLTDKYAQRRRLAERGVDGVDSVHLTDPAGWASAVAGMEFPVVVKPVRGERSRDVHRVDDPARGQALVEGLLAVGAEPAEAGVVVERYLSGRDLSPFGDYVAVESAVAAGHVTHLAVTGKLPLAAPFRETGHLWPDPLSDDDRSAVLKLVTGALEALEVDTAITHTEVKLSPDGPHIIEVNGRIGGYVNDLCVRGAGVDLFRVAGRMALGETAVPRLDRMERVVFQQYRLPPLEPCTLTRVTGVKEIRRHPNVDRYRTLVRAGAKVGGGVSTHKLDMICGHAADHAELFPLIEELRGTLVHVFE